MAQAQNTNNPLKIKHIAFFAFPVTDIQRAREFYEGILGLTVTSSYNNQFFEYDIGETTLSIGTGGPTQPSPNGGSIAFEVDEFEQAIAHLKKQNVKFNFEPMDFGVCNVVSIADPDGNTILIHRKK